MEPSPDNPNEGGGGGPTSSPAAYHYPPELDEHESEEERKRERPSSDGPIYGHTHLSDVRTAVNSLQNSLGINGSHNPRLEKSGLAVAGGASGTPDYRDALAKSLVFFDGQRSGKLPPGHGLPWRADSGLNDGAPDHVDDLTGGYYDAGDNVKFGLPMAFTTTMLAWSVLEFGKRMPAAQLHDAREAVRWGTDYLLKASAHLPQALYVQVGNPYDEDHSCWERAEAEAAPKPVYKVTPSNPGSDVAGETAAALAAASVVFRRVDRAYSKWLRATAVRVFDFADRYWGRYSDSLSSVVCPFCSYSGYEDELLWASAWLYQAIRNSSYLDYPKSLGLTGDCDSFSWDKKYPGARVLLAREYLVRKNVAASEFRDHADRFVCSVAPTSPSVSVKYTPGGLLYKSDGSNLQYVTSTSFLLATYAKYLRASSKTNKASAVVQCGGGVAVTPSDLQSLAQKQVDYILGSNGKGMPYMVGYGGRFPRHVHHRDASIPSANTLGTDPAACSFGSDAFADDRSNDAQSEPATYINAPLVGTLAFLSSHVQRP